MAEEHAEERQAESEQSNGHNLGRAAVIAAASGATAYAARKAFSGGGSSSEDDDKSNKRGGDSVSLVTAAVASGWDVAKDSLLPVVEEAATKAGAFVAERAPEVVRDVVLPRFIAGFERGKRRGEKSES